MASGHLFVTQGNLCHLACDAILVPSGIGPEGRKWHLGSTHWRELDLPLDRDSFIQAQAESETGRVAEIRPRGAGHGILKIQAPAVYAGHTGEYGNGPSWYADAIVEFVRRAARETGLTDEGQRPLGDPRPLLGVPLVGTGLGGLAHRKGDVVKAIVEALLELLDRTEADIALVLFTREGYSAAQQARLAAEPDAFSELSEAHERDAAVRLAARVRQKNLVLFLGAGVSMGAGLPSWSDLLGALASRAEIGSEREAFDRLDARDQAEILKRRLGKRGESLSTHLKERLSVERVALLQQLLASLDIREVATTNYDSLFDQAWTDVDNSFVTLPGEPAMDARRWILKLHGSLDAAEDVVISRDDYLNWEGRDAALGSLIQAMLLTRHMLFVGYSLSDDNFHRLVHEVRRTLGSREARARGAPFGTALSPDRRKLAADLWEDEIEFVNTPTEGKPDPRRLAILIDYVGALAAPPAAHVLDETYAGLFSERELEIRDQLWALQDSVDERESDVSEPLREALRDALSEIGGQLPSARRSAGPADR